jgi:hypothetical protein
MNILPVFIGGDNKIGGVQECIYLLCKYLPEFNHSVWSPYGWTPGMERLVTIPCLLRIHAAMIRV